MDNAANQPAWAIGPSVGSHVLDPFPGLKPLSVVVVMGQHHSVSKLPPVTVSKNSEVATVSAQGAGHSDHSLGL